MATPTTADPDETAGAAHAVVTTELVGRLLGGDEAAWREFLIGHHAVFVRAVRTAAWRSGMRVAAGSLPQFVDEAKTYFYTAFTRTFRAFESEGRFYAFLFVTVANCVREQVRADRRAFHSLDEPRDDEHDGDEPEAMAQLAVDRWTETGTGPDPGLLARMNRCLGRLPHAYRAVVVMHFFQEGARPLRCLAEALGASVENVHKRFQRALKQLRECMALQPGVAHG
jgi:RNA polymerase sigma factor (sigma-70 family)